MLLNECQWNNIYTMLTYIEAPDDKEKFALQQYLIQSGS